MRTFFKSLLWILLAALLICLWAAASGQTQTIQLRAGWNLVSSNVIPEQTSLDSIFKDKPVQLITSMSGVYWPAGNVRTLTDWSVNEAYKVKTYSGFELTMTGQPVELPKQTEIKAGVNYLPVYKLVSIQELFRENLQHVYFIFAQNESMVYCPLLDLYDLRAVKPGNGYLIFSLQNFTITWQQ